MKYGVTVIYLVCEDKLLQNSFVKKCRKKITSEICHKDKNKRVTSF